MDARKVAYVKMAASVTSLTVAVRVWEISPERNARSESSLVHLRFFVGKMESKLPDEVFLSSVL